MSSKKRPFAEFAVPTQRTPSRRNAPLTPHSKRAHEQRSAAKQRSTRPRKPLADLNNLPNPDSARGVLQRLAKITAPITKRRPSTPNQAIDNTKVGLEQEEGLTQKRPIASFELGDSLLDEDESELPPAPTPSALLDDDNDQQPTLTFTAINFGQDHNKGAVDEFAWRRASTASYAAAAQSYEDDNDDGDITAEVGRRAISEGPHTEPFSRYSFGSIRMSDFGAEVEGRRQSLLSQRKSALFNEDEYGEVSGADADFDFDAETEDLRRLRASPSLLLEGEPVILTPPHDEATFHLELPNNDDDRSVPSPGNEEEDSGFQSAIDSNGNDNGDDNSSSPGIIDSPLFVPPSPPTARKQTALETTATLATSSKRRRKGLKLTKHGITVPSLPSSLIKRVAVSSQVRLGKRKPKLGKEHMKALEQATEWFFEQVGEDLGAYSTHAGRKKRVDESDVLMLMKRQRVVAEPGSLRKLAKEFLGKEVCRELDLPEQL